MSMNWDIGINMQINLSIKGILMSIRPFATVDSVKLRPPVCLAEY